MEYNKKMDNPAAAVLLQTLNLCVLTIGVATVFVGVGRRDSDLTTALAQTQELKEITGDLARICGGLSVSDASIESQLKAIERRLDILERR